MFGVINDAGHCIRQFYRKADAKALIARVNALRRAQDKSGEWVKVRWLIGIAQWKRGHPIPYETGRKRAYTRHNGEFDANPSGKSRKIPKKLED